MPYVAVVVEIYTVRVFRQVCVTFHRYTPRTNDGISPCIRTVAGGMHRLPVLSHRRTNLSTIQVSMIMRGNSNMRCQRFSHFTHQSILHHTLSSQGIQSFTSSYRVGKDSDTDFWKYIWHKGEEILRRMVPAYFASFDECVLFSRMFFVTLEYDSQIQAEITNMRILNIFPSFHPAIHILPKSRGLHAAYLN